MSVEHVWLTVGFLGQAFFSARFLVQWVASERRRRSVIPVYFWYLSLAGGLTLFLYAVYRRDPVFILGQGAGLFVYLRNLHFIHRAPASGRPAVDAGVDARMGAPDEGERSQPVPPTINWAQGLTRPLLMIPGPTELAFPVIQAMNAPPTVQYDASFDERVLEPTLLALRTVFKCRGEVFLLPGSGRTALEAGATSVIEPGDRVLVVVAGQFGALMREILARAGAAVTEFTVEGGRPLDLPRLAAEAERIRPKVIHLVHNETSTGATYPADAVGAITRAVGALFFLDTVSAVAGIDVRTDEWGVDLNMTGSQKCLGAPLGLGLVSVSDRAWEAMERRRTPAKSYAYDLLQWRKTWVPAARGGRLAPGAPRSQPVSIPTHLTAAMRAAVELIGAEGLEHRFARHAVAAAALRSGLEAMRLELFPDPAIASNTVTCVRTPAGGIDARALVTTMRDRHGILVGTGLDKMRTSTLRIGTMNLTASPAYILPTLSALELALREHGYKCEPGAGLAAAQATFADAS